MQRFENLCVKSFEQNLRSLSPYFNLNFSYCSGGDDGGMRGRLNTRAINNTVPVFRRNKRCNVSYTDLTMAHSIRYTTVKYTMKRMAMNWTYC